MASVARWSKSRAGRSWSLGLLLAYVLACVALLPAPSLRAQEAKKEAEAPAADAPPADAPRAETAAPSEAPAAKKSLLRWAIEASGPIGLFLLCLSVYFT